MTIAYLLNQHPYASCTFIRREILALEARGIRVQRYAIRRSDTEGTDPADAREREKTRVILAVGTAGLAGALAWAALHRPGGLLRAIRLAVQLGLRSERGLPRHAVYLAEACVLARWLADEPADHVHAHFATNATAVAALCHILGGPGYSFTVHGPDEFDHPKGLKLGLKVAMARFVVAISEYTRSQLFRWCDHREWDKIRIVHCGLDGVFLGQSPTPVPASRRFVCVGRLGAQKGQLLLVEAAARLVGQGLALELVLVGDGPLRPEIERLAKSLHIADHVRITGWQSGAEVREAILASRALVLPSFAEGLPVGIMEALALGRPVISTYVAGIPELVEPGVNGWLVPAGDVEKLAAAMRAALEAPTHELDSMGAAGRLAVEQRHCIAREAGRLAALFESCVAPATGSRTE